MSDPVSSTTPARVAKGDVIRIVPERGPERLMRVARVERHVITLSDFRERVAGTSNCEFCGRPMIRLAVRWLDTETGGDYCQQSPTMFHQLPGTGDESEEG